MSDAEEWRVIEIAPDYEVSSLGRVRRCTPGRSTSVGRLLTPSICRKGYAKLRLRHGKKRLTLSLATEVCRAFHGPPFPGADSAHEDGDQSNNRAVNLSWKTRLANMADRDRHGRTSRGSAHPKAVLTEDDVRLIRTSTERTSALARVYGVSWVSLNNARIGKTWKHVL